MPRIEKVRLVGVQYDSMRKHYEDTTLDLMNGTDPAHTLLTLMNGGGKGLLLQMLFQLLLPLTRWGAKGENRIEALFYNERKQFVPYTFHVVLEWRLDTDPVKWLMTGIAVSAREKATAQETDLETAEPRYLLYTLEQIKPGRYEIENLPLYDKQARKSCSIDEWKDYLTSRRSDFTLYTHTQTKDYRELLKSYDIDPKEWETLRDVNRQEGGVEAFFRKGLDNHSLFHDLIIPEVAKHMAMTDEEGHQGSLLDIFKHNAAIAQHLPKLMRREDGYRLLLQGIDPVMSALSDGVVLEQKEREHERRGAQVRHALKVWLGEQAQEKQQWQAEQERAEESARELRWREHNLDYAVKHRDVVLLEQELLQGREQLVICAEELTVKKGQGVRALATVLWNEREEARQRVERYRQEQELLRNAEEHRHVHEEMQRGEADLLMEWERVSSEWQRSLASYGLKVRQLESDQEQTEQAQRALQASLQEKSKLLGDITGRLQVLNTEKMEMERAFGRQVNEAPERLVEQHLKQLASMEQEKKDADLRKSQAEQEKEKALEQAVRLQEMIKQSAERITRQEQEWQEQRAQEEQAVAQVSSYLRREPMVGNASVQERLIEGQRQLVAELERLQSELVVTQQQLWTHQLDVSLAKESYWIPNQELTKLKDELSAQGLQSYYGSEMLAAFSQEDRDRQLRAYPLLPYSLVMLQSEWKKHDPKRLSALLMRAPAPIYLREGMLVEGEHALSHATVPEEGLSLLTDGALLLGGKGMELVSSKECLEGWKKELQAQNDSLLEQTMSLKERVDIGSELGQAVKALLARPDSTVLERGLDRLKQEKDQLRQQQKQAEEDKESWLKQIAELEEQLQAIHKETGEVKLRLDKLESWGKRLGQGQVWQKQKSGIEQDIAERNKELDERSKRVKEIAEEQLAWNKAYVSWKSEQEQILGQVKRLVHSVEFLFAVPVEGAVEETAEAGGQPFTAAADRLQLLATKLETLQGSMEERNQQLALVANHLEYARKDTAEKEQELDDAYPNWRQEELTVIPLDIAQSDYKLSSRKREEAERNHRSADKQVDRLEGKLEAERDSLKKLDTAIRQKHGKSPEVWDDEDLGFLRSNFESERKRNAAHLAECRRLLGEIDRTINQLDMQLRVLATHRLSGEAMFEVTPELRRSIRLDASEVVTQWVDAARQLTDAKQKLNRQVAEHRNRFVQMIRDQGWDAELSGSLQQMLSQIHWDEYTYASELLMSVKEHAQFELESLAADKAKAEQARDLWTDRACYRVISITKALKQMTNRMSFVNQGGHRYPLIRMDLRGGELPEKPEEIRLLLRDYFVRTIDELSSSFPDIAAVPDAELLKRMSDSQIVFTALKSRYPVLHVYKPQTTNVFLYESPKKHHYTEWETLNKGSVTEAKGSGGQLLTARTIVMMMLMTHKRQLRQTKMWSVLILDNPFGQAVSPHVLDPIFAIAENLRFQWIVLAPPELIKLDVSRRFPVFWELELKRQADGETVTEKLQHGGRSYEGNFDLFGE